MFSEITKIPKEKIRRTAKTNRTRKTIGTSRIDDGGQTVVESNERRKTLVSRFVAFPPSIRTSKTRTTIRFGPMTKRRSPTRRRNRKLFLEKNKIFSFRFVSLEERKEKCPRFRFSDEFERLQQQSTTNSSIDPFLIFSPFSKIIELEKSVKRSKVRSIRKLTRNIEHERKK